MSDYHSRKAARTAEFAALHGVKWTNCGACNGSGHYDHTGSPPCGACDGVGKVREAPAPPVQPLSWRETLQRTEMIRASRKRAGLRQST
jgi:DnaJ-class molecular chaperone